MRFSSVLFVASSSILFCLFIFRLMRFSLIYTFFLLIQWWGFEILPAEKKQKLIASWNPKEKDWGRTLRSLTMTLPSSQTSNRWTMAEWVQQAAAWRLQSLCGKLLWKHRSCFEEMDRLNNWLVHLSHVHFHVILNSFARATPPSFNAPRTKGLAKTNWTRCNWSWKIFSPTFQRGCDC